MLEINKINKMYKNGTQALKNVSLTIEKGIFGLLGPNGAGKTTLLKIISTLLRPDSGEVVFNGIDVLNSPLKTRQRLGYLPQEFGLYPNISAEALLDHLAVLKGVSNFKLRKDQVNSLLEFTNLYSARKKKLGTFSGGMKQRFGIAQALLNDPLLLVIDEPTAGLDPQERNRFYNLISEVSQEKIVILSTHIVADVNELCTQMAILNKGEIVMDMAPENALSLLEGKVWKKKVQQRELQVYKQNYEIVSSKFLHGNLELKVYSELPLDGFERVFPEFEDVYFVIVNEVKNCQNASQFTKK